jgi:hypothetical protein
LNTVPQAVGKQIATTEVLKVTIEREWWRLVVVFGRPLVVVKGMAT